MITTEEKAKRYDLAIETAKSEDDRIRESLLEYLHTLPNHYAHSGVCAPEWIAWLENVDYANKEYWRGYREGKQEILDKYAEIEKQGEQILANSAKTCKDEQKLTENKDYSAPFDIEIPFGAKDSELIQETIRIPNGCYASIEGNEIVIKKGQKSAEWSEEDERIYRSIAYSFAHNFPLTIQQQEFVKSLKERYIWKPTDLQIEALESATENCAYSEYQDCLRDLIKQLKQLSGNYIQLDPKGE